MTWISQVLGFLGAAIVAAGYVPQIVHIAREGCSAGVSVRAWCCWLVSSVLVLSHALMVFDGVFIALQSVNVAAIVAIIVLAKRYERATCASHVGHRPAGR